MENKINYTEELQILKANIVELNDVDFVKFYAGISFVIDNIPAYKDDASTEEKEAEQFVKSVAKELLQEGTKRNIIKNGIVVEKYLPLYEQAIKAFAARKAADGFSELPLLKQSLKDKLKAAIWSGRKPSIPKHWLWILGIGTTLFIGYKVYKHYNKA